jgi:ribonuclease HI
MDKETYYVVKRGHKPGIYKTWLECKAATDSFKSPIFKKFASFDEANEFYKMEIPSRTSSGGSSTNKIDIKSSSQVVSIPSEEMAKIKEISKNIKSGPFSESQSYNVTAWNCINDEIYLFTDGSARKSRTPNDFNSGVGVYLGYQCMNIKEQYNNKTNNQCELMGIDYVFKLIIQFHRELSELGKVIKIVSDSEYSIKACSVWLAAWKTNNWRTKSGEEVKNRDLIESIDGSMSRIKLINSRLDDARKIKVKFIHVNSHQLPDITDKFKFSIWFGNYIADGLSQNSI